MLHSTSTYLDGTLQAHQHTQLHSKMVLRLAAHTSFNMPQVRHTQHTTRLTYQVCASGAPMHTAHSLSCSHQLHMPGACLVLNTLSSLSTPSHLSGVCFRRTSAYSAFTQLLTLSF